MVSLIWPSSTIPRARASRASFSTIGQFVRRYFCAWTFVGSLVCRMQRCRALPLAIRKETVCGPSLISSSVGLTSFRMCRSLHQSSIRDEIPVLPSCGFTETRGRDRPIYFECEVRVRVPLQQSGTMFYTAPHLRAEGHHGAA